jgi:secondary thiamine-phosphate synthase enzyme
MWPTRVVSSYAWAESQEGAMQFEVATARREQLVDITEQVTECVSAAGVSEGVVVVYCPHTTAGITINENADPDVVVDLLAGLERLAPRNAGWRHREGNSDGHLKSSLIGSSVTVPLGDGRLMLGTWQGIYLGEFDGPRRRKVLVTVLGAGS